MKISIIYGSLASPQPKQLSAIEKPLVNHGVAELTIQIDSPSSEPTTFDYETLDGTAIAGADYVAVRGSATIPAGETTVSVFVPIIDRYDTAPSKSFSIRLSNILNSEVIATDADYSYEIKNPNEHLVPFVGASKVAVGSRHACALTLIGSVVCWGNNGNGQLGNNTNLDSKTPVEVIGLTGAVDIKLGESHACALTSSGAVYCWGNNLSGQLGNGSNTESVTPVPVTGLSTGTTAITLGDHHSCALVGTVSKCWGDGWFGQLGNGSYTSSNVPLDVIGLGPTSALRATASATCALLSTGAVRCWGLNTSYLLGSAAAVTAPSRHTPANIPGISNIVRLEVGGTSAIAVNNAGTVYYWGWNTNGLNGSGTSGLRAAPTAITSFPAATAPLLSLNLDTSCYINSTNQIYCAGGLIGNETYPSSNTYRLSALTGPTSISVGTYTVCAVDSTTRVWCWGTDLLPTLNGGPGESITYPADIAHHRSGVVTMKRASSNSCAMLQSGDVNCWGTNSVGQLGGGSSSSSIVQTNVVGVSNAQDVTLSGSHTCVILSDGHVSCWGANLFGQLGIGNYSNSLTPQPVIGLSTPVTQLTAGALHTCARQTTGAVSCWGDNLRGQLGDGTTTGRNVATSIGGISFLSVSAANQQTCGITTAGGAKCWGDNSYGQLGDGTTDSSSAPVDVQSLNSNVRELALTSTSTCALLNTGNVKCWGSGTAGQLGNGSTTNSLTAVNVQGLPPDIVQVSAGAEHVCARSASGKVYCWGANQTGQLGDGTFETRLLPVVVAKLGLVKEIQMGQASNSSCAVLTTGGIKCWGDNSAGVLGIAWKAHLPHLMMTEGH